MPRTPVCRALPPRSCSRRGQRRQVKKKEKLLFVFLFVLEQVAVAKKREKLGCIAGFDSIFSSY
jgi:hypothetical protein